MPASRIMMHMKLKTPWRFGCLSSAFAPVWDNAIQARFRSPASSAARAERRAIPATIHAMRRRLVKARWAVFCFMKRASSSVSVRSLARMATWWVLAACASR